jgi:hypothetical protein
MQHIVAHPLCANDHTFTLPIRVSASRHEASLAAFLFFFFCFASVTLSRLKDSLRDFALYRFFLLLDFAF